MNWFLRKVFFFGIARPLLSIILGVNVRNRERLRQSGPAIIAANHNSHLDTLVLMTISPSSSLERIRPVAAADYFLKNKFLSWFSQKIIQIIPIDRKSRRVKTNPLEPISTAIDQGDIVILFPEGSRGEPEQLNTFKSGIAHLAKKHPKVPIIPVFMHGLGKALPRGETILVPFFCDVYVGESIYYNGDKQSFLELLEDSMKNLASEGQYPVWE